LFRSIYHPVGTRNAANRGLDAFGALRDERLKHQCASADGTAGGTILRISGTIKVATRKQAAITKKASAKVWVCASRQVSDHNCFNADA
jgi:hypothetical protein